MFNEDRKGGLKCAKRVKELMELENKRLFAIFYALGILATIIVFIPFNAVPFVNIPFFEKGAPRIYLNNYHIHHFWFGIPILVASYLLKKSNALKRLFRKHELHVFYFTAGVGTCVLFSQIPEIILAVGNPFF